MIQLTFPESVSKRDFGHCVGVASRVAWRRKIKGRSPSIQTQPDRPGVARESEVWYVLKASRRFIDVLAGVFAGEGYLVAIEELPDPWEKPKESAGEVSGSGG